MTQPFSTAHKVNLGVCCLFLVLPFLAIDIPPITDLPQQVAQIRLLEDVATDSPATYRVQWWEPNKLAYVPLWLAWQVASPLAAGRLAVVILGLLWLIAIFDLARRRQRSSAAAILAGAFFFNHALYWGLLNFLIGLPIFILWLNVSTPAEGPETHPPNPPPRSVGRWFLLVLTAYLLYASHALWWIAGVVYLVGHGVRRRFDRPAWLFHLSALAPVGMAAALWYPRLASRGFDSQTFWAFDQRWHAGWWVNSAFGGLQGPTESWLAAGVGIWLCLGLLALWRRRRQGIAPEPGDSLDRRLLAIAGGGFLAAMLLPAVHQNTVFFASRWLPMAVVFLVLAVPPPPLQPWLRRALPVFLFATLSVATTDAWLTFDRQELDGLHDALSLIEAPATVLGLDFVRTSESIQGFPYYHLYAWSQALHGGEVARSFANEASSLVVYTDLPRQLPWTPGLDWRARKLRRSDIDHFDYVILHGDGAMQRHFFADPRLEAVTPPRRWCLFKVDATASDDHGEPETGTAPTI